VLTVQDKVSDGFGQLVALPLAFASPYCLGLAVWGCRTGRLDGVRGGAEIVSSDVRDAGGLPGGVRGMSGGSPQVASRAPLRDHRPHGFPSS
jgi:hypothetical protein